MMNNPKKILLVDDEQDLIDLVGFQFRAKGFEVETAGNGLQALELLNTFAPDLIVLDMNMPRMGGVEFYSKICDEKGKPKFPVLVLTARANIKELFKDLLVDGFMIKPFEIDQLVLEAENIIRRSTRAEAKQTSRYPKVSRKICIVEDDPNAFGQLMSIFVESGYTVMPARKGAEAIEKMVEDVPDIALVKLGLSDFAGDMVILRLSQMSKTMEVKFVLYSPAGYEHNRKIMENLGAKSGVLAFVEYREPKELLAKVDELLKN